jgi:dTDP-4-amino-4,6-dideoxygalactose transaminase
MREELALFGGEKTARDPFPPWPQFAERTFSDIQQPLRSGRVSYWSGVKGREFEEKWALWVGARHAVSCSSGTAALHIALAGLGIGPGDEVIVPSHTFIATSLSIVHAGAIPVFCDVSDDQTLDPRTIETLISARTRAIVAVHLYGIVCAMDRILEIARGRGLAVLEDCAQCVGGENKGRKAGTLGDAGCFSFSQGKHISSGGEGGMIVTNNDALATACRSLRDYGREAGAAGTEVRAPHIRAGYNFRLTEIQSIVGLNELERLESWNLARRFGYAKAYDHAFSQLYGVKALPLNSAERRNAYWKYPLQLDLEKLLCGEEEFRKALVAEGIPDTGGRLIESYEEPVFAQEEPGGIPPQRNGRVARCPNAEALSDRTVSLGLCPTWERSHIELCISAVKKILRAYKR